MGDLFKQTAVDIDEIPRISQVKNGFKQSQSQSQISEQQEQNYTNPLKKDIFRFYNLQVELPKTFFGKLGDNKVVKNEAINLIKLFIKAEWPVLGRRKRLTYRVSYDSKDQIFNTVLLGKEAPLSHCCMRNVNFVFEKNLQPGAGKVLCMDPFCANNTIDTF